MFRVILSWCVCFSPRNVFSASEKQDLGCLVRAVHGKPMQGRAASLALGGAKDFCTEHCPALTPVPCPEVSLEVFHNLLLMPHLLITPLNI